MLLLGFNRKSDYFSPGYFFSVLHTEKKNLILSHKFKSRRSLDVKKQVIYKVIKLYSTLHSKTPLHY